MALRHWNPRRRAMHLTRLRINNFRALEEIDVSFDSRVSVIIGPNAIGKTTVLEAIRLAKGILAPRTQNEANQVLISLGALSPHLPQRLFSAAMTNKPDFPLSVKCTYRLADDELALLRSVAPTMSTNIAQQSAGMSFTSPAQAQAFLSSPMGHAALAASQVAVESEMQRVAASRIIELNLTIDFRSSNIFGEFPLQQAMFAALEQARPPTGTLFSYFPADRALPSGEQPLQLGMADTVNQLESYNSQPQLKYQRLKNTIFNSIIGGSAGRSDLRKQFQLLFEKILRGKDLGEIGLNEIGMLSIPIIELESNGQFQIDGLSSGEKGLILTFLLIAQNVDNYGLVLLDEPELHLNPAVCRDLLQFFVDEFAEKRNIQGIICSHSAEILAGTFERESCSLFHLRDGKTLAKVRREDHGEIRDALRRLGSSESEALLYKGAVSVEGIHDAEILQSGFDDIFRRYKVKDRGGRSQIEKDIAELQKAEGKSEEIGFHYFIFDLDKKPTKLKDSIHVRLFQLDRYCLENYLLDVEILTDLSRKQELSSSPKQNIEEMRKILKDLALTQLDEQVSRQVFVELGLEGVGFDMDVTGEDSPALVAVGLRKQIDGMISQFNSLIASDFENDFIRRVTEKRRSLEPIWNERWQDLCNGKLLFEDLRETGHFRGDLLKLKKEVIGKMRSRDTPTFKSLATSFRSLLGADA
jgi:predicted ATPase